MTLGELISQLNLFPKRQIQNITGIEIHKGKLALKLDLQSKETTSYLLKIIELFYNTEMLDISNNEEEPKLLKIDEKIELIYSKTKQPIIGISREGNFVFEE